MSGGLRHGHLVMWSHGLGSRTAAERVKAAHGISDLWCGITETFSERADAYRFGVEALFHLYGEPCPPELVYMARAIPDFQPGTAEERAASVEARKTAIRALASAVMRHLPRVLWRWEGRTPWEVARDWGKGMLPSSRVPICSIVLKAEFGDLMMAEFDPRASVVYFGLEWSEPHRLEKVRARKPGWTVEAPLTEAPYLDKAQMLEIAVADGLTPSVAYTDEDADHDNCGGACFKAGQGAWARLHRVNPPLFLFNAQEEGDFRAVRGDYAILRDRRGGQTRPLPLPVLASRIPAGQYDAHDFGGCGCFIDDFGAPTPANEPLTNNTPNPT